jgi:N-acetylglucosamine-6-phosphate deacetylase
LVSKGITVAIGHSQPTQVEYELAVKAGATMITHLFNGMSGVNHKDEPGLALLTLTDDRMIAGLIADMSHVNHKAV